MTNSVITCETNGEFYQVSIIDNVTKGIFNSWGNAVTDEKMQNNILLSAGITNKKEIFDSACW